MANGHRVGLVSPSNSTCSILHRRVKLVILNVCFKLVRFAWTGITIRLHKYIISGLSPKLNFS